MSRQMPTQFIQREVSVSGQVATAVSVFTRGSYKIRIVIRSDSVDRQSSARAFIFQVDQLQWAEIASIAHTAMKTSHGTAYRPDAKAAGNYEADFRELLAIVDGILNFQPDNSIAS